jgi:hypothetical protein
LLWQVLGETIDLPFNAYDHRAKLTFDEMDEGSEKQFCFDLGGNLRRRDPSHAMGEEAVEVFIEVKSNQTGDDLLKQYREFLRRAAIVSLQSRHRDTWFIFLTSAPFGSSYGMRLCDGSFLSETQTTWHERLKEVSKDLHHRTCLVIATQSFERLLKRWGRDVERLLKKWGM